MAAEARNKIHTDGHPEPGRTNEQASNGCCHGSKEDIINYGQSLSGGVPFVEVKSNAVWIAVLDKDKGEKITIKNISSSDVKTKARWTIDIKKNDNLKALGGKIRSNGIEIKFR